MTELPLEDWTPDLPDPDDIIVKGSSRILLGILREFNNRYGYSLPDNGKDPAHVILDAIENATREQSAKAILATFPAVSFPQIGESVPQ